MPKSKTKSKITKSSSLSLLPGRLRFDKTLLAVIAAVVVATGGYLFYQGTHAATAYPSAAIVDLVYPASFMVAPGATTSSANSNCFGFIASTTADANGNISRCMQIQPKLARFRTLTYYPHTKTYVPDQWIGGQSTNNIHQVAYTCNNSGNFFSGWGPITGNVAVYYGQEFRPKPAPAVSGWQIRLAAFNGISHNCLYTSTWHNVVGHLTGI